MNINRLLENSKRTSLIGKNIYTYEGYVDNKEWIQPSLGLVCQDKMNFGICIGHQIENFSCGVYPEFYENDCKLVFQPVRHRWTPSWQETYYRCLPDPSYYLKSGCISVCEKKCITSEDVFYSSLVLQSDKRETTDVLVKLISPYAGKFDFEIKIGALGKQIRTSGYICVKNTASSDNEFTVSIPANGSVSIEYSLAFSKNNMKTAEKMASDVLENNNVFTENEKCFNRFMDENAPRLTTDNIDILKIYYYRWFLVYRALHNPSEVIHNHPINRYCFYESPYGRWFGCPVGLPVPCHTEETKWMINPKFVYSNTFNWIDDIGNYQNYIQYTPMAIWHLHLNHPNKELLEKGYNACCNFAMKRLNPENDGLEFFKVTVGSWVTGAEYQPAFYQHRDIKWDWTYDVEGFELGLAPEVAQIYKLDDITYSIGNLIGCLKIAKELGKDKDCENLVNLIDKAIKLLIKYFWNEKQKCFVSVDAHTKKQCDEAKCYDSFFPYLWGIIGNDYYEGFRLLEDDTELSCTFGVTSVDKKCPMYWFDNCITGPTKSSIAKPHSYRCSWNGPVWPYAVSGVLEALGASAMKKKRLRALWLENFCKYTELHFMEGDRSTPMITEHYRPTDGYSFSNTCDYFHSTWIDLFMKYWAGIQIDENGITFSPFTEEEFTISNVIIDGKKYEFNQKIVNGKAERSFKQMI